MDKLPEFPGDEPKRLTIADLAEVYTRMVAEGHGDLVVRVGTIEDDGLIIAPVLQIGIMIMGAPAGPNDSVRKETAFLSAVPNFVEKYVEAATAQGIRPHGPDCACGIKHPDFDFGDKLE